MYNVIQIDTFPEYRIYDDFAFTICKTNSFWDFIGLKSEFMKLNRNEREKIYLKWRYGTNDFNSNKETEMTDITLYNKIRDFGLNNLKAGERAYWEIELARNEICMNIKEEIGLGGTRKQSSPINKVIRDITQSTGIEWQE
jgi:hypothetical protein